ncbi:hypothetical protein [Streptacidiphilus sp. P02-A3a]|uniref:hypothetical protein n=1 Tax=Streptacidiphilus sp. P02-A3a TaxID=2704468 RepID=UPI0015FA2D65|nr:hypothetical protein [Streptacidiphilus sp. P02-A3a]QMU70135.1 hypothetical protein GXP74_19775 [Streptacidiphilus sp. P02-A3a]QMU70415.1 hypothetical protein GXP74_21580 [Streptacidiphilus sp. P02-A3a]
MPVGSDAAARRLPQTKRHLWLPRAADGPRYRPRRDPAHAACPPPLPARAVRTAARAAVRPGRRHG